MKTKIKSLTIISQPGTKQYEVGFKYNGLKLHKIEDKTIEYEDYIVIIYIGYTKENEFVFEVINAPIEVAYE